jgi:hypothetical protein
VVGGTVAIELIARVDGGGGDAYKGSNTSCEIGLLCCYEHAARKKREGLLLSEGRDGRGAFFAC